MPQLWQREAGTGRRSSPGRRVGGGPSICGKKRGRIFLLWLFRRLANQQLRHLLQGKKRRSQDEILEGGGASVVACVPTCVCVAAYIHA